ncbi:protein kinase [Candidatus Micrarchaeota archaeon]|nr:protein kinase [Candidatus Micrarchaeota archaeon]
MTTRRSIAASLIELRYANVTFQSKTGSYHTGTFLGGGGYSVVHQARNIDTGEQVALKICVGPKSSKYFYHEAQVLLELGAIDDSKPRRFVPLMDFDASNDPVFLVFPLMRYPTLDEVLDDPAFRGFSPPKIARLGARLAQAAASFEKAGIHHRDLKPANIFMVPGLGPVIFDFNIARLLSSRDDISNPHFLPESSRLVLGSPTYMAPEVVDGNPSSVRSEIHTLAFILAVVMHGGSSFFDTELGRHLSAPQVMIKKRNVPVSLPLNLSPILAPVVAKALEPDPERRFDGFDSFIEALTKAEAALSVYRNTFFISR